MATESVYDVLTEAISVFSDKGFDSAARMEQWQIRLRRAAEAEAGSIKGADEIIRRHLDGIFKQQIGQGGILRHHTGVTKFDLTRVNGKLHAELERRIVANAGLIKLNRDEAISRTLRRMTGWMSSVPKGGSEAIDKRKIKAEIAKPLKQLPYEERRVAIDQGHKMVASLSEIVAKDNNAIAVMWKSHYRQAGYNYRKDHKERDGKVYMLKGNWAQEKGLVKVGPDGYYDDITAVGEEPFCRCYAKWLYNLRSLPEGMLTVKGREALGKTDK